MMFKRAKKISFEERVGYCLNPTAKRLCEMICRKRSNLCLSADLTDSTRLLDLVDQVGAQICLLKTHADIVSDFNEHFISSLEMLAQRHGFLIFEDRKFADIGSTVKQQYVGGLHRIVEWADISSAHTVPGPGVIQGLQEVGLTKHRGLLLLAEMSSAGSLAQGAYTRKSVAMAEAYPEFVIGFVAQGQLTKDPGLIHLTPGVQWENTTDSLGQRYVSPARAVINGRTDVIIVGRGIYEAKDPLAEAVRYRTSAWEAYLSCC